MANKREISHKYFQGLSKYEYCPYCVKRFTENGENWKEKLKPLKYVVTAEPIKQADGTYRDYVDSHCECLKCGNTNITDKTFLIFYCCRPDGTKYNEPRKEPATIWSKEKNTWVYAKWNTQKGDWEEIIDKAQ